MNRDSIQEDIPGALPRSSDETGGLRWEERYSWEIWEKDQQLLQLLSLFWFIMAGLYGFGAFGSLFWYHGALVTLTGFPVRGATSVEEAYLFLGVGTGFVL